MKACSALHDILGFLKVFFILMLIIIFFFCTVHPLIQVPNQLVGAPTGTDVTLQCHVEASPKAINYWTRDSGTVFLFII